MLSWFTSLLVQSPLYPHWLETLKKSVATDELLQNISGKVLEVGAGDGYRKQEFLKKYPAITKYLATDYAEWDGEFSKIDLLIQRFGKPLQIILGYHQRAKLDQKCDAMNLPFKDNSFDYHLSFETIEHISDPWKYFKEASRVLKKGGYLYVTVPFLYRMHGGEPEHRWDFFRYGFGSFYEFADKNKFSVIMLKSNTGYGTTMAALTNQYVIRRIFESPLLFRPFIVLIAPFIFIWTSCFGYLLDLSPDIRFSTRFHVLLQKK